MTVKELKEALAAYPDDMEVMAESAKNALGTFSVHDVEKWSAEYLESNWREIQGDVCLIRFR